MRTFSLIVGTLSVITLLTACAGAPPANPLTPNGSIPAAAPAVAPEIAATDTANSEAQAIAAVDVPNSVFFNRGSVDLDSAGKAALTVQAERLKANPRQHVVLIGYTDDLGSRAYNLAIADRRVQAVYAELRRLGVPPMQMKRSSMGTEKQSRSCVSDDCRRLMRRVEIIDRR